MVLDMGFFWGGGVWPQGVDLKTRKKHHYSLSGPQDGLVKRSRVPRDASGGYVQETAICMAK